MKTVQTVYGVFDTDLGRLVGIAPQGVSDVTFLAGQDTQTVGYPVTALVNPVTGGIELSAGGEPITVGGGGITPDATGVLADRDDYDAEAIGFAYLATDQTPAEYYFREGVSGWSAAVTVRGPTGATGAQGSAGSTGATGPSGADGTTFVAGTATPNDGDGRPNGTVYVRYAA